MSEAEIRAKFARLRELICKDAASDAEMREAALLAFDLVEAVVVGLLTSRA